MPSSLVFTYAAPPNSASTHDATSPSVSNGIALSALPNSDPGLNNGSGGVDVNVNVDGKEIGVLKDENNRENASGGTNGALSHLSIIFIVLGVALFWTIAFIFIFWSVRRYRQQKEQALHSTEGRRQTWHTQGPTIDGPGTGSQATSTATLDPPIAAAPISSSVPAPSSPAFRSHKVRYPRTMLRLPPSIHSSTRQVHSSAPLSMSTSSFTTDVSPIRHIPHLVDVGAGVPPSPSPTSISFSSRTPLLSDPHAPHHLDRSQVPMSPRSAHQYNGALQPAVSAN
ncbi:hypothetical protein IAU59_000453 [Kwoniella sp. CBS 9459]